MTPSTLPASLARKNFYTLIEEVNTKLRRFTITRRGQVKAILLSPDEVASWEETMEIMADKKLLRDLAQAQKEYQQGKVISEDKLLKQIGLTEADLK